MENTQRKHTQKERLKSTLGRESGNPKEMAAAAPTVRRFTSLLVLREDGAEQLRVGLGAHDLVILVDVALRRGEVLEREHHLCMHTVAGSYACIRLHLHVAGPGPLCLGWGTRHRRTIWCASDAACDIMFCLLAY